MKALSLDIESYSSTNLAKSGVYRYALAEDFEILLLGYSVDSGPVRVVDLSCGEKIPAEILRAIKDETVTKWAFNANFERICLSRFMGLPTGEYLNPASWKCSMVWAATMGLPLSLEGVGAVLKLDKQKLSEGKDLIRYFCQPCAPTASNGQRTRNLSHHAPDKWEAFKRYNSRDVETEMAIQEKLCKFPVPDTLWDEYHLDQEINDRGVALDMELVREAISIDGRSRAKLTAAMKHLTELENPNSVQQMKQWLADNGMETDTLGKKAVTEMLKTAPMELADVLTLRQQLAKSSVRKYQAMENCVCADGRARGMFLFYGANRTGRFCLTGDHEVLTDIGWKRLDEWQGGTIACWNAATEAISFQPCEQASFDYEGPMYTYTDVRIDQCSTPDHKMRAQRRYGGQWEDMTVEQMSKYRPVIPFTGYRYHRGCVNPAWLRVLIMTHADGYYKADGSVRYHFKKQRKVERCKTLLRRAEIPFVVNEYKHEITSITVPARAVPLWLRQFRTKTFGFWLLDENPDLFFDELPNWDGYYPAPNSIQYSTTNRQNADIVQALAHMSGRSCSMKIKHRPDKPQWQDTYVLTIWLTPGNRHELRMKPIISNYSGKVYCAVTSTGYFLVRRNGRVWVTGNSGRLIQLQNLPQNHLKDLAVARALVHYGDSEALEMLYQDVPDTLSQLIRTAFIPKPGNRFFVADFSAIEARVIAWLAGEDWRLDVFERGEDIYCASASQMFHVPVEKNGINGHLRQKGKVAELACIAEGSLVLTNIGLIPIEQVTTCMRIWDGCEWVKHEGVIYKGTKEVIEYEGLRATPDHLVWVEGKAEPVQLGDAASRSARLVQTGCDQRELCLSHPALPTRVYDIRNAGSRHRYTVSGKLVHNCGYGGSVGALKAMGALEMGLQEHELSGLIQQWRSANPNIVRFWWDVDRAVKICVSEHSQSGTHGIRFQYQSGFLFITLPSGRRLTYVKPRIGENQFGGQCVTYEGVGGTKKWERLESYGPKFVENIVQATARDILAEAMLRLNTAGYRIVMHVHDEVIIEAPETVLLEEVCALMGQAPAWAKGLQLRADGYVCDFYQKQ